MQLGLNSIGAIAGVALTFYFLMPMFKGQMEQIRALTKSILQHELRAESRSEAMLEKINNMGKQSEARHVALLERMDTMHNQHIESFKSLESELAESKKVAQDIYAFNLSKIKERRSMGGVES